MSPSRIAVGLSVVLAASACRDPAGRPDAGSTGVAGSAAGATGAAGASGGSGGTIGPGGAGGGSGGTTEDAGASGGSGGPSSGGTGGGGVDQDAGATDAGRTLEPIRITEGKQDAGSSYHDLHFVGAGLEQYEGDVVTFRIGPTSGSWRTATGQTRIVQGAFDVLIQQVVAPAYESKLAHIDADGSGQCDVGEPVFLDNGLQDMDTTLTFTPDAAQVRPATAGMCDTINNWPIPQ